MKVRVAVKEITYGTIGIYVKNEEEIEEKVWEAYENGEIDWHGGDFDIVSWEKE